jgi:Mg-chelatase subunit ChlD
VVVVVVIVVVVVVLKLCRCVPPAATNINAALLQALQVSQISRNSSTAQKPETIIIFLTDGEANVSPSEPRAIIRNVKRANTGSTSIFTLALGMGANFDFLKQLSLRNTGFARKIYEASDTALQLRDFYRQVASPLLANVTFRYEPNQVSECLRLRGFPHQVTAKTVSL